MGGLRYVAREASFEAKASEQSPTGVGGRRVVVVAGERRIRGNRWAGSGYADAEHRRELTKSLSVRRKSLTSAWRRSMSSTRKTPEHPGPAYNLPEAAATAATAAEAAEAATEAAEAAEAAGAAGVAAAAAAAEAAGGGCGTIDIALGRHGRAWQGLTRPTTSCFAALRTWMRGLACALSSQPCRETLARELNDALLGTRRIRASQWRSALVAIRVEVRVLTL